MAIIALSGDNSFGWQQELNKLVFAHSKKYGDLAVERFDAEEQEIELADLKARLFSEQLFAEQKLVIFRSPSKNKQWVEDFEQILADVPDSTDVVIVEPKLDKRSTYYKFLKGKTDFREFTNPDVYELGRWLTNQAKQQGGLLSSVDARYLVERVGLNQQLLFNELNKLLLYDPFITKMTIDLLTEPLFSSTIFELLEAAFKGQPSLTLKLYKEQRDLKVEPPQIIAMLTWQLQIIALVKYSDKRGLDRVGSEAKLNSFVLRKSQILANNLGFNRLKELISDLLSIDISGKSTGIDLDEALMNFLLALA